MTNITDIMMKFKPMINKPLVPKWFITIFHYILAQLNHESYYKLYHHMVLLWFLYIYHQRSITHLIQYFLNICIQVYNLSTNAFIFSNSFSSSILKDINFIYIYIYIYIHPFNFTFHSF